MDYSGICFCKLLSPALLAAMTIQPDNHSLFYNGTDIYSGMSEEMYSPVLNSDRMKSVNMVRDAQKEQNLSKPYHLITGATGLLGTYLLRDLLRRGDRLVVLARPSRRQSARERIDSLLARWERMTGENFLRPVVIEGNLAEKEWWTSSLDWIAENCRSVINCAASLTFHGIRDAEPWITNIEGSRQVLELCRAAGIESLHHFSTAYVAGSYRDRFTEEMLDVGQKLRNDYEQSKFESEKMVREADWIRSLTVYRPSIVVGDSKIFTTNTYHGYYAVLKLAHTLVHRLTLGSTSGRRLLEALGMNGSEYKNFVPVDWVSDVFTHIFSTPELHGRTYHLTNDSPTPINEMVDTIQEAVETFSTLANENDKHREDENWFMQNYADQVGIYQNYLNDDPHFDAANTRKAAPFPCPKVDRSLLLSLSEYAIKHGFGKPAPKPIRAEIDVQSLLDHLAESRSDIELPYAEFGLRVFGNGGGEWTIHCHENNFSLQAGISEKVVPIATLDAMTLKQLLHENDSHEPSGLPRRLAHILSNIFDNASFTKEKVHASKTTMQGILE